MNLIKSYLDGAITQYEFANRYVDRIMADIEDLPDNLKEEVLEVLYNPGPKKTACIIA